MYQDQNWQTVTSLMLDLSWAERMRFFTSSENIEKKEDGPDSSSEYNIHTRHICKVCCNQSGFGRSGSKLIIKVHALERALPR